MNLHRTAAILVFGTLLVSSLPGCGYRLAGTRMDAGMGRTLAVPTFENRTTTYRIEQVLTDAVRSELIRRTRYSLVPGDSGDAVVTGQVLSFNAVPIMFNQQGRASSYNISVDVSVNFRDSQTGRVMFQDERWTFREVFELAQNSSEFVPEDPAAMDRLARLFASSLVASMLHAKP